MERETRESAAEVLRQRLRADLRAAMKDGRRGEVKVLRALVSAIDQAEAPPAEAGPYVAHDFRSGSAETARLDLDAAALRAVIAREIAEREQAGAQFEELGMAEKAEAVRAEADVARRYLD